MGVIEQEVSTEPEIEIPEEVREVYKLWRPTPLYPGPPPGARARYPGAHLLQVRGRLAGRLHKPNSAVAQAYFNKQAGMRSWSTETGAGQWGSALSLACRLFGLECEVFMVGVSYDQKPYRRAMIETWGGTVHRSPTDLTDAGRSQAAHESGSLGIAISEAVEVAAEADDTNYALGSVLNHVCLHQTVIGQEAIAAHGAGRRVPRRRRRLRRRRLQLRRPIYPFVRANLRDGKTTRFLGAEPAACPTLTRGTYAYDFGDTVGMTPLMPMYTLGHDFVPPPVHAGGLRYHGDAPSLCALVKEGIVEATAVKQTDAFDAAVRFACCEGIIPGPEPAHAIRATIEEAAPPSRRARSGSSSSASPATATSTCPPTPPTTRASSRTSSSPTPKCNRRSTACPRPRDRLTRASGATYLRIRRITRPGACVPRVLSAFGPAIAWACGRG